MNRFASTGLRAFLSGAAAVAPAAAPVIAPAILFASASPAQAQGASNRDDNTIRDVSARADGGKTVITLRGTATPSFTAYRLEQPARLVVDLAGGRLGAENGPLDVDTWAVGQIAFAQYSTTTTRSARVMIGLKRAATYDVKARGNDVVITVIPEELPPAAPAAPAIAAEEAKTGKARASRLVAEARQKDAEARQKDAEVARGRAEAEARAAENVTAQATAKAQAAEAMTREAQARTLAADAAAKAAKAERDEAQHALDRLGQDRAEMTRKIEAARAERDRLGAERDRIDAERAREKAAREAERAKEKAALDAAEAQASSHMAAKRAAEQTAALARVEAARAEAEKRATAREAELLALESRYAAAQAQARSREAALAKKNDAARVETERLAALREVEEKRLAAMRAESERIEKQRDSEERSLVALRSERQKLSIEAQALEAERVREHAELAAARAEAKQLSAEQESLRQARAAEVKALEEARHAAAAKPPVAAQQPAAKVAVATQQPAAQSPVASQQPAAQPFAINLAASHRTRVTSVDFRDEAEVARVVIALSGEPDITVLKTPVTLGAGATDRSAVLRIRAAELPARLARTLDTSAFGGPVASVSTYTDPDDPDAVRVVARLASSVEPRVRREHGRIFWDFPKPTASITGSWAPARVAGYGIPSIPLQFGEPPAPPNRGTTVGGLRHRFSGSHIDLDFKDADIHNILRLLADVGQVNIITSDEVKGTVTIRMRDTPWDQALDVILRTKGLGQVREGNLIRVAPQAVLEKEQENEIARNKIRHELLPLSTRLVPLSYADAGKIMPRVQDVLSPRGRVSVDERTNTLIISDTAGNLSLAEDLIRNLDTQTPQVLIEARIVEARTTFLRDIGIQWGGGALASSATGNPTGIAFPSTVGVAGGNVDNVTKGDGLLNGQAASPNYVVNLPAAIGTGQGGALGFTFGSVAGNLNVNLRLSAAETQGNVRIISAPKITTLDNVQASIEQGTAIPIAVVSAAGVNTQFVDAKLNLTVKPHVTHEGSVVMLLEITRNEPDFSHTGARGDPTILKKQAKTEMLVRDGDTAVIGGIYSRNAGTNYSKIPYLGDIPILGWFFKQRKENDDRSELLIFITPRIVNRSASIGGGGIGGGR